VLKKVKKDMTLKRKKESELTINLSEILNICPYFYELGRINH